MGAIEKINKRPDRQTVVQGNIVRFVFGAFSRSI